MVATNCSAVRIEQSKGSVNPPGHAQFTERAENPETTHFDMPFGELDALYTHIFTSIQDRQYFLFLGFIYSQHQYLGILYTP